MNHESKSVDYWGSQWDLGIFVVFWGSRCVQQKEGSRPTEHSLAHQVVVGVKKCFPFELRPSQCSSLDSWSSFAAVAAARVPGTWTGGVFTLCRVGAGAKVGCAGSVRLKEDSSTESGRRCGLYNWGGNTRRSRLMIKWNEFSIECPWVLWRPYVSTS